MTRVHPELEPLMTRLARDRQVGPDGTSFPWGPIDRVHQIGPYQIVEYRQDNSNAVGNNVVERHNQTNYSAYVDGVRTGNSHRTLDESIAFAIAYRHEGLNSRASAYFIRMIGAEVPQD